MTDETKPSLEPALTVTYNKVRLHPEDIERILTDKLPGHIPFLTENGASFPGCRLIHINGFGMIQGLQLEVLQHYTEHTPNYGGMNVADAVNQFFALFASYYQAGKPVADGHGGLWIQYSSILDEEDNQDMNEITQEIRVKVNAKRAERQAAAAAAKEAKDKELADLLTLARAVRDAGGVAERIAELVNANNLLQQENVKLAKKLRNKK